MKQLVLGALALLGACASVPEAEAQRGRQASGEPIVIGRSYTLASQVLEDERQINVWTPPGYSEHPDRRYTVLYVLDGALDQDFEHIAGLAQLGSLSATYGPVIVVGVQTKDRRAELTRGPHDPRFAAEFPQAGGARKFQDFLQNEVIPYVESHYLTGPRRALMGESLAGLFVVDTFLHRPTLFQDYIAISPSLWWDNQHFARHGGHDLEGRAASDTRLYLAIANEGGATQDGMNNFIRLLEAAPRGSVTWRYLDRSASETHATIYHGAALDALRWLYPQPPYEQSATPWYYEIQPEAAGGHGH